MILVKVIRDMFQTLYICKLYLTLIKLVLLITFKIYYKDESVHKITIFCTLSFMSK